MFEITDPCEKYQCNFHGKCRKRIDGTAECICPICNANDVYSPVCGYDGKTYANICEMRSKSCNDQKNVLLAKEESCGKQIIV